ncbi:SAM-dependent methyltransferase [Pseudorhodoplanes sp.]|uniref:SAM-dependent methyltransferase n=1 Tax=Pseudorhodoplanes sp. TaxID=1934341 RepID=UPI002BB6E655|nr:methyltransferase domain-containing protein [Pseudorhodoplanes sp.]HWV53266.1 methyltransferase domain-containing protein [Pseudorhodoplanes sp.]
MISRLVSLRPTVLALTLAAGLAATTTVYAQQEPRLDVIYVPTPQEVVDRMLELAKVGPGDYMIDFGCGDGRMVVTAAKRGARGYGVDINPQRIKEANENAAKAGVTDKVEFKIANLFEQDLSKADVMAMYLLTDINLRLRPKILDTMRPGTRIVSHAFDMGDWKPEVHENVNGRNVYFWIVPAKVGGKWQVDGGQKMTLDIDQKYQFITGKADIGGKSVEITDGKLTGANITFKVDGKTYTGKVSGDSIAGDGWKATKA